MQHCDALDYWGGGTRVTVTSELPVSPTVVPMVWLNSASGNKVTVSCLALDFYPQSLSFEWSDASGAQLDSVRYPVVGANNRFTEVSLVQVSRSEANLRSFQCSVIHPGGTKTVNAKRASSTPKLTLLSATTGEGQTLVCTIEDFSPENLSVKWKKNGNEVHGHNEWPPKQLGDLYSAVSVLKVKSSDWNSEAVYSCEVTHLGKTCTKKTSKALFTVKLNPPSPKQMFSNKQVELECIISGQDNATVSGTEITWYINEDKCVRSNIREATKVEGHQYSKHSFLTYNYSDWRTVSKVRCSALAGDMGPFIQDLTVNKGDGTEPKVTVHLLHEKDIGQEASAEVTLVCLVSSNVVQDYYIAWTEDVGQSSSVYYDGITFPPGKTKNGYSVTSVYTTTKEKWNGGYIFYCNVWPTGLENHMKSRGVSQAMEFSTLTFAWSCTDDVGDEDEFSSLWFTALSLLFLFMFSLSCNVMLSLQKRRVENNVGQTQ
ncbi:hypothetical protein CHARACLAT_008319 [Characodon lateralis]|uniref:Ig-like domain-containing protein n=1 Tax=Characodon lateralis TaxID=208331 RepID=A0ABU7CVX3_9TELE|nr:hypothetical protein [Characodon lateralis]